MAVKCQCFTRRTAKLAGRRHCSITRNSISLRQNERRKARKGSALSPAHVLVVHRRHRPGRSSYLIVAPIDGVARTLVTGQQHQLLLGAHANTAVAAPAAVPAGFVSVRLWRRLRIRQQRRLQLALDLRPRGLRTSLFGTSRRISLHPLGILLPDDVQARVSGAVQERWGPPKHSQRPRKDSRKAVKDSLPHRDSRRPRAGGQGTRLPRRDRRRARLLVLETAMKGSVLATKVAHKHTRQKQCLSCEGSGYMRQKQCLSCEGSGYGKNQSVLPHGSRRSVSAPARRSGRAHFGCRRAQAHVRAVCTSTGCWSLPAWTTRATCDRHPR